MAQTLLIVDDSRVARMMLRAFALDSHPALNIIEAASADEALLRAEENPGIDLVSIDYNMPGKDGMQLAEALQIILPKASKALLTANIQDSVRAKAQAMGLFFVAKPITAESVELLLSLLPRGADGSA